MFAFSQIAEDAYDTAATQITYCKLFPLMIEDFVTRKDAEQMMAANNLPFQSQVIVNPGQAVQVVVPAGTGSTASPGVGSGKGMVSPIFTGGQKHPSNAILLAEKKAIKESGGRAATAVADKAVGK